MWEGYRDVEVEVVTRMLLLSNLNSKLSWLPCLMNPVMTAMTAMTASTHNHTFFPIFPVGTTPPTGVGLPCQQ